MSRSVLHDLSMAGQFPKRPTPSASLLPEISPALFRHQRFWRKVAPYRPLFVLAGIWVVLLAISLVAYERLLYTEKDPTQRATDTAQTEITMYPHQRLEQEQAERQQTSLPNASIPESPTVEDPEVEDAAAETLSSIPPSTIVGLSPWTLGALVFTCALGCSLLSRQLQAPPRPCRKPQKRLLTKRQPLSSVPLRQVHGHPGRVAKAPSGPKRLATYNPNAPLVPPPPRQVRPQPSPPLANNPTPAVSSVDVTVVPDDAQHPLDWPEESLVNTADVRRRRSLSSFM